jgi:hypothetical protein
MRHLGEDKGHRAANGLLAVRDNALNWHLPWLQHLLDFGQQGRQIPLRTAEQWTGEQDLLGKTVADYPQNLMSHIGLQPIKGQDYLSLLL